MRIAFPGVVLNLVKYHKFTTCTKPGSIDIDSGSVIYSIRIAVTVVGFSNNESPGSTEEADQLKRQITLS